MRLTLSTALMLVSGQITAELRDSINSKERRIREDVVRLHLLSDYFSAVNKTYDTLKDHLAESVEVKEVTFSTCCQVVVAMLNTEWNECYRLYSRCIVEANQYMTRLYIDRCSQISELEHVMLEISNLEVR